MSQGIWVEWNNLPGCREKISVLPSEHTQLGILFLRGDIYSLNGGIHMIRDGEILGHVISGFLLFTLGPLCATVRILQGFLPSFISASLTGVLSTSAEQDLKSA